jgi:hypothetical protein
MCRRVRRFLRLLRLFLEKCCWDEDRTRFSLLRVNNSYIFYINSFLSQVTTPIPHPTLLLYGTFPTTQSFLTRSFLQLIIFSTIYSPINTQQRIAEKFHRPLCLLIVSGKFFAPLYLQINRIYFTTLRGAICYV